ncbi:MAG TPA: tetratricopeptide repeat protein [Micromonosporaceae bacterium]|nr:tetratricopeptide repeat protein [Micromonosporaceae bacterium]
MLRDAWALTQQLGDPIRLATVRINEAFAYSSSGDLRLARGAYREAAELYRRGGAEPRDVGYAVRGEASTLAQVGRFVEALVLYRQADELFDQAGLALERTRTAIGAVMARASLGERLDPDELDRLERQLRRLPPNEKGQLARNLGNIALNQGDPVRAERLYLRARRAFRMLGRTADVASVNTNRAVAARLLGDRARAVRLLLRAHRQLEPLHRWRQLGHINHNLALVLTEQAVGIIRWFASVPPRRRRLLPKPLVGLILVPRLSARHPTMMDTTTRRCQSSAGCGRVTFRACSVRGDRASRPATPGQELILHLQSSKFPRGQHGCGLRP